MAFANNLFFYYDRTIMPAYIQNRIAAASLVYGRNELFFLHLLMLLQVIEPGAETM